MICSPAYPEHHQWADQLIVPYSHGTFICTVTVPYPLPLVAIPKGFEAEVFTGPMPFLWPTNYITALQVQDPDEQLQSIIQNVIYC